MQISYSLANIQEAVHQFWQFAHQYRLFVFNGGLGAGKTTFTVALCHYLGVVDVPSSPTFSIINEYHFQNEKGQDQVVFHSDWYRLRNEDEAIEAGIEDMLNQSDAICIVEWAERAPGLLQSPYVSVDFEVKNEDERSLILNIR